MTDTNFSGIRVVHAADYKFARDGQLFSNWDLKAHHGLVQNGCYVYPFSINDRARMFSPTGSRVFGQGRANKALLETCRQVHPDLLLLGHSPSVGPEVIRKARAIVPKMRIALWWQDAIWEGHPTGQLFEKGACLDAIFISTSGDLLKQFVRPGCPAAYVPNPAEASIHNLRAFENPDPEFDLTFFGRDRGIPSRSQFLKDLRSLLPDFRLAIFGSLGERCVFGHEKDQVMASSRMGLNLSQRNDVALYSSDRIAQLIGNGLLTFCPTGCGLEALFGPNEVVFFDDVEDLAHKARDLKADDSKSRKIARAGWEKIHKYYSAREVVKFMLNVIFRKDEYRSAEWGEHVYWPDE